MTKLAGKVAVVTGSGRRRGLGEAIARRLAADGAAIVLSDLGTARDKHTSSEHIGESEEMAEIAAELRESGARVTTATADVRQLKDMQALAAHAVSEFGRLDIWVNNAGIGYLFKPMLECPEDEWRAVIDKKATAAAVSSGSPVRPSGMRAFMRSRYSSIVKPSSLDVYSFCQAPRPVVT